MSTQKFKLESYTLLGGINQKVSQYNNTIFEFLDIKNMDFQTPGALTQRWGSTQYISQGFSNPITSVFEFQKLNGSSFVFVGHTGGLWFGATTGQSQGVSLNAYSSTIQIQLPTFPHYQAVAQAGPVYSFQNRVININYKDIDGLKWITTATTIVSINPIAHSTNVISSKPLVDNLFTANGNNFLRFDGSTFWTNNYINPHVTSSEVTVTNSPSYAIGMASFGMHKFYASYVNNRGFESEIYPIFFMDFGSASFGTSLIPGSFGGSFVEAYVDLYTPSAYGISTINIYSHFGPTTALDPSAGFDYWYPPYVKIRSTPASTGETTRVYVGAAYDASLINISKLAQNVGGLPDGILQDRLLFGSSFNNVFGSSLNGNMFSYENYSPKFLSSNYNIMFASGFSALKSTVFFSDTAEPQGYNLENSFEVRTNDGDEISGQITYGYRTMVFKRKSSHMFTGDNANNLVLSEISSVYGCINNECACLFENMVAYLDFKGIVVYNGSNPELISQKIQPIFDRINLSSAINTACMVHDKLRSQILCAIPIDGSTQNNITIVFDYLARSFTTYDGFNPTVFAQIQGRNSSRNVFYGTSSGLVNWFGPSFLSDNASGFTCYFKTKFNQEMGESVQKQFRRLYLNADVGSATFVMPINFYQDYGTSKVIQSTFILSEFQSRYDFGISAKSLAYELSNLQTSSVFRIYGFTIESRRQRNV